MNRQERRALGVEMRRQAASWPAHLDEVPKSEWPSPTAGVTRPVAVWRSRSYLVQQFTEAPVAFVEVRRLTVNRVTIGSDGHWDQDISWDDLQRCKRETGHGDWYAVEVYPRDRDIVHVANMRHLWLLAEPLSIGWFESTPA